jgi:hypothetical protein
MKTMTAKPSNRGRRPTKFTTQAMEKLEVFIAEGKSREEIAKLLNVTVGSLQVTCSRLGISLRRCQKELRSRDLDRRRRNIPASSTEATKVGSANIALPRAIAVGGYVSTPH